MWAKKRLIFSGVTCVVAIALSTSASALSFTVTAFADSNYGLQVWDINDNGQVVGTGGYMYTDHNEALTDPDWRSLSGRAINNSGQVTGIGSFPRRLGSYGFLYDNGQATDLSFLGGQLGIGTDINDQGHVVGYDSYANGRTRAFYFDGTNTINLGVLESGQEYSYAYGLNEHGQVVGRSGAIGYYTHAFLYEGGAMTDLGTLGGDFSSAEAINEHGQIVGYSSLANGDRHAFIYEGGAMISLGTLGGANSFAQDINDAGFIVGESYTGSGALHAYLYDSVLDTMIDLNDTIDPASGWVLESALALNNSNQIIGWGRQNGAIRSFLLTPGATPIPEPATWALLGIGLTVLGVRRSRRSA